METPRWRRILDWTTRNTLLVAILFDFIIIVSFTLFLQRYNDSNIERAKDQAVQEAKERAEQIAASNLDVCKRAVVAVTSQSKADDLKLVEAIKDRYAETGRPVPALYVALEAIITNRQPPTAACEPKENP